jgi:hypothetical protein
MNITMTDEGGREGGKKGGRKEEKKRKPRGRWLLCSRF